MFGSVSLLLPHLIRQRGLKFQVAVEGAVERQVPQEQRVQPEQLVRQVQLGRQVIPVPKEQLDPQVLDRQVQRVLPAEQAQQDLAVVRLVLLDQLVRAAAIPAQLVRQARQEAGRQVRRATQALRVQLVPQVLQVRLV